MKKNKIVLPKSNTNDNIDTFFSSRFIHFDDEKNGILNIVKIKHNYTDLHSTYKIKTKTSSGKIKTKTSYDKVKTKTSTDKVKSKTSSGKVKTKSQRYY